MLAFRAEQGGDQPGRMRVPRPKQVSEQGTVSRSRIHPLPEPLIELVAQRFRVLGEPMRIKLLDQLREGEATVGELQQALGATQQNISKHLGILHSAGMVSRTKQEPVSCTRSMTRQCSNSATRSAAAPGANSPS